MTRPSGEREGGEGWEGEEARKERGRKRQPIRTNERRHRRERVPLPQLL